MTTQMRLLFLSTCLIALCSCKQTAQPDPPQIVSIDMRQAEVSDFDRLVSHISCIKLSAEDEAFPYQYKKIIPTQNRFYLLGDNGVCIHNRDGKRINRIPLDQDEFFFSTITREVESEELWIVSLNLVRRYTSDGIFLRNDTLPFSCTDIVRINENDFLVYDGGFNRSWEHAVALTDLQTIRKFFIREKQHNVNPAYATNQNSREIFLLFQQNDTIYRYSKEREEVAPFLHLDFHGDLLTKKIIHEKKLTTDKAMSEVIEKQKYFTGVHNMSYVSGCLFFQLNGKDNSFRVINPKSKSVQTFNALFNHFPVTSHPVLIGCDESHLYCLVKEKDLVKHYVKNTCTYPEIQKLLSSLQPEGNHTIILKIKLNEKGA